MGDITKRTSKAMTNPRKIKKLMDNLLQNIDDNVKIQLGDDGATDSYIVFDGAGNLTFYDSAVGAEKTLTELLAASGVSTLDEAFDGGKVINGAVTQAAAMSVGGATDFISFWQEGANDVRIDTSAGANLNLDSNGGEINILSDTTKLGFGAAGASTDGYIYHDGTNLRFWDSALGAELTLSDMAGSNLNNPTVIGDLTAADGKISWTDLVDENVVVITGDAVTSNSVVAVSGDGVTTGNVILLSATEGTLNGGAYINCYDETAAGTVFKVAEDGAVTITGAASDVLTLTLGDFQMTDGNIDMDEGKIEVDSTTDETSYVKRNAAGSAAVLEIEQTHTASTGSALLIDQNSTGNAKTLEISTAGDGAVIDISASAARTGNVITIAMANQEAQTAIDITGAATGTAGEGILHLDITGAQAGNAIRVDSTGANLATGSLMVLSSTGAQAAPTEGICAFFEDTGAAAATSYAVSIASTSNEALHVSAGKSLFGEQVAITLADNTGPALVVTNPDTTGNTNAVSVVPSGSGAGIVITPQEVDTQALLITTVASSAKSLFDMDLTTGAGWIGADGEGAVRLTSDGTNAHANASLVNIIKTGATVAAMDGSCLRIDDASTGGATAGYAVSINASGALEALHVDAGTVVVDETVQAIGGILTAYDVSDVTDPPSQAEMDAAFGAGSSALNGMIGVINDADGGTNVFLCVCANDAWYYAAKLTIGA